MPPDPLTGNSRESSYGPDSLWNYEIGVKSYLLDRRLRANVALFDIDWRDIQINQQDADGFNYTANAGKVDAQLDEDAPSYGDYNIFARRYSAPTRAMPFPMSSGCARGRSA